MFAELVERFDAMADPASAAQPRHFRAATVPARLCLYATHDTTILLMLIALGVYSKHWPPYAANLSFELRREAQAAPGAHPDDAHTVTVLYNGKPVILPVSAGGDGFHCSLREFKTFVGKWLPDSQQS